MPKYGKCAPRYCFRCERKRETYRFTGFVANLRKTVVIADTTPYPLCQECAYTVHGVTEIDRLIKLGILAAWKPSNPIQTEQLQMKGIE
jgi:hypothetical protein